PSAMQRRLASAHGPTTLDHYRFGSAIIDHTAQFSTRGCDRTFLPSVVAFLGKNEGYSMTFFEGVAGRINSMIHRKDPSLIRLNDIASRFHLKSKGPTQSEIAYLIGVCGQSDKSLK